jgi:twitching motility protein PilT
MKDILELLHLAKERLASDLHFMVDSPPILRINGDLEAVDGMGVLSPADTVKAFNQLTTEAQRAEFYNNMELDFSYSIIDIGRFRCNASMQRQSLSLALRLLPPTVPTIDELDLPSICKQLALMPRGLIIISGPTGSGKTTTLAAMINHINMHKTSHVVTIEDPLEYNHINNKSIITQRELGIDTQSFSKALKYVLRQDPDIILVGEMRDLDTAAAVLNIAETGHLVLTTGHAPNSSQAIERIIDLFPPHERYLSQVRLASTLDAVLCQTLVPRTDDNGRIVAVEIMLGSNAVKNLIREGKIHQLPNVIRTGSEDGMKNMDQSLVELFLANKISEESMFDLCLNRRDVEKLVARGQHLIFHRK